MICLNGGSCLSERFHKILLNCAENNRLSIAMYNNLCDVFGMSIKQVTIEILASKEIIFEAQ
ncbi:MAG: hypothetical protein Phog2KO_23480 [Phototrophicaceae bacterium]